MAYEESLRNITLIAGADLSTRQYSFVSIDANGNAALTTAGAQADGVVQDNPQSGEAAAVGVRGISKVKCGGNITRGSLVAAGANGLAVAATSGDVILGTAMEAGAANRIISVLLAVQNHGKV